MTWQYLPILDLPVMHNRTYIAPSGQDCSPSFTPNPEATPMTWTIRPDPTDPKLRGLVMQVEYEPGEFCSVWVAREIRPKHAPLLAEAPELLGIVYRFLAFDWKTGEGASDLYDDARDVVAKATANPGT
jgi:hypothetical protein